MNIFIVNTKNMLFNCGVQPTGASTEVKLISGNTWGECVAYLEGTGDAIQAINVQNVILIPNDTSSSNSYAVTLKDNVTGTQVYYIIYDTYANVISWIQSQTGKTVQTLSYQNRQFVQL